MAKATAPAVASSEEGRWDLSSLYPPLGALAFDRVLLGAAARVDAFASRAADLPPLAAAGTKAWVSVLLELEDLEALRMDLVGYIDCIRGEDPSAPLMLRRSAEARRIFDGLKTASAPLFRGLARASEASFLQLCAEPDLAGGELRLGELRRLARHALPPQEERFIAEASEEGLRRWADLAAATLTSTRFEVVLPCGDVSEHAMSERYALSWDARADIRRAAFEGLERALAPRAPLLARCFNAMAGFDHAVARRRDRDLVTAILQDDHRINLATVETMQTMLRRHAPVLQAYLKLKARLLGLQSLGVFDRSAPLPAPSLNAPGVRDGLKWVMESFARHCPALADYSRQIDARRWLESEQRPKKRAGGFCSPFPLARENRVFLSYSDSINNVATLAHEFGHAFHNHCNFDLRWWAQLAPAPLAETAAILCEHFLRDTVARDETRPKADRIAALTSQLDAAVNYLVRIPRDFDFELTFLKERQAGDVGLERLRALMADLHRGWFGDAMVGDGGDSLSWAYNHIMMDPALRLYNFPYSFGYLLSRRIADAFYAQGEAFTPNYVAFLRASGAQPVEDAVASTLGFDVRSEAYWTDCLACVDSQVSQLSQLMD